MSHQRDRDAYRVSEVRSSGIFGDRRETRLVERGKSDRNKNKDYHLEYLLDMPSQLSDVIIVGLSFMSLYFFVSSIISELIIKHPDTFKVVLLLIVLFVALPVFLSIYAISRNIKLMFGVLYRFMFASVGILFGVL
jgi:hypothetical protein